MSYWLHVLSHWLGWNTGKVVSKLDSNGNVWIAFECGKCGKVSGAHITKRGSA